MSAVLPDDGTRHYVAGPSWPNSAGPHPDPGHRSLPQLPGFSRCLLMMIGVLSLVQGAVSIEPILMCDQELFPQLSDFSAGRLALPVFQGAFQL